MKKSATIMLLAMTIIASQFLTAFALEIPKGGKRDRRVKFINYDYSEVVKIVGHYGYSTHIQFDQSEHIINYAIGDSKAWDIANLDNHIFLKPVGKKPETNMTIITNKRIYNFDLSAYWAKNESNGNNMYYQVTFGYPEEIAARKKAEKEAQELQKRMHAENDVIATNWNYWAQGSINVSPTRAFDNGRFTFFKFANNRDMPAIYLVDPITGEESLVNSNINPSEPDTIIVHRIAPKFVFRKGSSVACLYNESYDINGITNVTGTSVPAVKRVVKEGAKHEK